MKKLQISYSLLTTWMQGNPQKAVDLYLRMDGYTNDAMRLGSKVDGIVKDYVNRNKKFPIFMPQMDLFEPIGGAKYALDYNDKFRISGEFDVQDAPTIYELKCSANKDSGDYANDFQLDFYFLMAEIMGLEVDRAWLIRLDSSKYRFFERTGVPPKGIYDTALVYNTKRRRDNARQKVEEIGEEMYSYFTDRELL